MILFFYGEDNYRLKKKIKALKERFISSSLGDTNLAVLDGKSATYNDIVRQILAMPFLSRKRLVIIENLLKEGKKDTQEKITELLKKIPETTVLVFVEEGMPDRRTGLYKKLNQKGQAQEFKLLEEDQLKRWIRKEVEARGASIETLAVNLLVEYIGNDLFRLSNELNKLTNYNRQLTTDTIELLVRSKTEADIFKLVDAIGQKNLNQAMQELHNLEIKGENDLYILTMIVYQYRNLLIIKDYIERSNNADRWAMSKNLAMHPYVVQKTISQAKNYTIDDLKNNYQKLLDFDIAIKTGKMESKMALTLLLTKLIIPKSKLQMTNES